MVYGIVREKAQVKKKGEVSGFRYFNKRKNKVPSLRAISLQILLLKKSCFFPLFEGSLLSLQITSLFQKYLTFILSFLINQNRGFRKFRLQILGIHLKDKEAYWWSHEGFHQRGPKGLEYLQVSLLSLLSVFPPNWLLFLDPFSCFGSCCSSGKSNKAFLRQMAANSILATGMAEDCPSLKKTKPN